MAQILVRDLDDELVAQLKEQAKANHRSLQGEVKAILEELVTQDRRRRDFLVTVDKWRRHWGDRRFSDSTDLIRANRDSR